MENLSKKDISFRLDKIKNKASEINNKIVKNNEEFDSKYNFAKNIGVKVDELKDTNDKVQETLNNYIEKIDTIIQKYNGEETQDENIEEYKLLNNILYLDDIKLKNINELVKENEELKTKQYINLIASKANDLIRQEELKEIDSNINKFSKVTFLDKVTGKSKMKKAMLENYNLKRVEVMNKKYIPENKSLYEIVSITNNCGYKSDEINCFIENIVNEYSLGEIEVMALTTLNKERKIPFFFNKEFLNTINAENTTMLDRINSKKNSKTKLSEYEMYNDMLINDVTTLELLNFNNIIEEVS